MAKSTAPATNPAREKAVSFLRAKMAHAFDEPEELGIVSTGCIAVDKVVGGGFPRGKVSEIVGLESSGKSTLCMTACAKALQRGMFPVFIDVERSLKLDHAAKIGFDVPALVKDPTKGLYLRPDTFEEMLVIVDTLSTEGLADLVFVDSVPALVPEEVLRGKITEIGHFGQAAKLFAGTLPRLIKIIERSKTALVFVNQMRANIETDQWKAKFAAKEKSFGGYALRYYSSLRVELRQLKKNAKTRRIQSLTEVGKEPEVTVASLHEAHCLKSKVAQPYQKLDFLIRYDPILDLWGIDNLHTVMSIAQVQELLVEKSKGVFVYTSLADGKAHTFRGEDQTYDWFATHSEEIAALRKRLSV